MKKISARLHPHRTIIVVAIIGTLAAAAIPQYQDYTVKAKVGTLLRVLGSLEPLSLFASRKLAVYPTLAV